MADDPKVFVGLPEVKVSLLPGGGGPQRIPRLIGVARSLPYLLEAPRCYEEGVLRSVHEADLGSILGWGFPAWTGGTLSFIDTVRPTKFVAECKRLAKLYCELFKPTKGLVARAQTGDLYYDTAAKATAKAS